MWEAVLCGRVVSLRVSPHEAPLRAANQKKQNLFETRAVRGSVLDRSGQPLAKSLPAESICVNPSKIPDLGMAADLLAGVLKIDRARLYDRLCASAARSSGFLWVKRKVDAKEAASVRKLAQDWKLDWIEFRQEMRRFYPHGQLAAHVVGTTGAVNRDDSGDGGSAGIELAFEDDLAGRPGLQRVYTDVKQNRYDSTLARKPEPGATLTLTIDRSLQYAVERQLAKTVKG